MSASSKNRMVEPHANDVESQAEGSLRPKKLNEYIGQEKAKEQLLLLIAAAKQRGESLGHTLISGPPGLGKTTLSHIIAHEMGGQIHVIAGPTVEKKGDLAGILMNLQPRDVLFIDEIHRLAKPIEEVLYSAMEDFRLDVVIPDGTSATTVRLDLPRFTLVGATTRSGLVSSPLRMRFGLPLQLDFYGQAELQQIVLRSAALLGAKVEDEGAAEIAKRSRGTPRIANRLLQWVRDFAQVKADGVVSQKVADLALAFFEVDSRGLDVLDRKYLRALAEKFGGGPVGIETLSSALSEERDTLEEVCEPYLLQEGLVLRTPRGRVASRQAYEHLGLTPPVKNSVDGPELA